MSHRRAEILADESQQDSSSCSTEDVLEPEKDESQDPLGSRSSPTVEIPPRDDNSYALLIYRGRKMASFEVKGRRLVCLAQAFDLFLRDLVGGLHTVYTKLRRLRVKPVVCSVDQVRILRRLGVIQPGVNRCKMISPTEFDLLYDDCTNSRVRPGRPLKRSVQLRTSYVHGSEHMIENLMRTTSHPELCRDDVGQNRRVQTKDEDPKLAMTSYPVGLLAWSELWRQSPAAAFYPVAGSLEPHSALNYHPLYWRAHGDIPMSSCPGMKGDTHLTRNPSRHFSSHFPTDPLELRCLDHPCDLRQIQNEAVNEPLNLEVRGRSRSRSPGLDSGMQFATKKSRNKEDIATTAEETYNNNHESSDVLLALPIERRSTPSGDCLHTGATLKSPPADCSSDSCCSDDCSGGSCSDVSPTVDCTDDLCSIESLLKDVHKLVMVAVQNNRQRQKLISCKKDHLEMQAAKEMKLRHQVERQLATEQKNRVALQRQLRIEKRILRRLQTKFSALTRDGRQPRHNVRDSGSRAASEGTTRLISLQ